MHSFHHKKSIIKKITQIGGSALVSRFLGIIREVLTTKFLLAGAISDAFITAFRIPNSLRKIFGEGAISGAFIPSLVRLIKQDDMVEASKFMTLLLCVIESIVLIISLTLAWNADLFLRYTVPGFDNEQLFYAVPLLRILIFFIIPISFSAILGGALQSVHKFFIPALAPILYNIFFITSLCCCIYWKLSIYAFAYFILGAGLFYALIHFIAYRKAGFSFLSFDRASCLQIKEVLIKFIPVIFTVGVVEINAYIDVYMGSGLEKGTVTLMYYAHRFSQIPLGVFGGAFSTIFLPYFSKICTYAPKRLAFFMHEALKLIFYITVPIAILLMFFSYDIFNSLFSFSAHQSLQASQFLAIASSAIFFQSANKTLLSVFYSLNNTALPTLISITVTICHMILNYTFMFSLEAKGLLLAGALASMLQTCLYLATLKIYFKYPLYSVHLIKFLRGSLLQLTLFGFIFYQMYIFCLFLCEQLPQSIAYFFIKSIGLWFWVAPLAGVCALLMFLSRKSFGIKLYFLD